MQTASMVHTYKHSLYVAAFSAILLFSSVAGAKDTTDTAMEAGFAPHKALYNIKLVSTKSGSQIINVTGQMMYEWQPSCDGWISNHRFNLTYEYADSPALSIASDFSNFESFDGTRLDFTSQRKRNSDVFEEIRGQAVKNKEGAEATYTIPKGLVYALPGDTVFPIRHTVEVLQALKDGAKFYSTTVFDGSDDDGPIEINAFIGKKAELSAEMLTSEKIDSNLLKAQGHKVRLAFFPLNEPSEAPDYEMDLVFHENGIISDMIVEYQDFSVGQTLIALEPLEPACDGNPPEASKDKPKTKDGNKE